MLLERAREVLHRERLVDHAVHAGLPPGLGGRADDMGRQGEDDRARLTGGLFLLADPHRRLEAVQPRHRPVHQDQVEGVVPQGLDRFQPVLGEGDFDPETLERLGGHLAVDLGIVDHQHLRARETGLLPSARDIALRNRSLAGLHPGQGLDQVRPAQRGAQHIFGRAAAIVGERKADPIGSPGHDMDGGGLTRVRDPDAEGLGVKPDGSGRLSARPSDLDGPVRIERGQGGRRADGGQGDNETEAGADALGALQIPVAAHGADQTVADGQPQPGAAMLAGGGLVRLGEGFEQPRQRLGRDPGPRVDEGEADFVRVVPGRDADQHPAGLGEFDGVVGQIAENPPQPGRIRRHRADAGVDEDGEIERLLRRPFGEQAGHVLGQFRQVHRQRFHLELAGLDFREVEDVVDDGDQRAARFRDDVRLASLARRQVGGGQQFAERQDAVHRRADLVAHHRQEVGLGRVRRLGRQLGLAELGGPRRHRVFQARDMVRDPPVALAQALKHRTQPADKVGDLAVGGDIRIDRIVLGVANLIGEGGQFDDRLADAARHAQGDQQTGQGRDRRAQQGHQHRSEHPLAEPRRLRQQGDAADRLALAHHGRADLQRAGRQHRPDRQPVLVRQPGVGRQPHAAAGFRQQGAGAGLNPAIGNGGHLGDGAQGREGSPPVFGSHRIRGEGADDIGGLGQAVGLERGLPPGVCPTHDGGHHDAGRRQRGEHQAHQLSAYGTAGLAR